MTSEFGAVFLVFLSQISSLTTLSVGSSFRSMLLLRIGHAMYVEKDTFYLVFNMQIALCIFLQKNMQMH